MFHNFQLKLVLKILHLRRKKCFAPKKPRELFTRDEDILLIHLNISKDLIVGNDKKNKTTVDHESLQSITSIVDSCERRNLVN